MTIVKRNPPDMPNTKVDNQLGTWHTTRTHPIVRNRMNNLKFLDGALVGIFISMFSLEFLLEFEVGFIFGFLLFLLFLFLFFFLFALSLLFGLPFHFLIV